MPNDPNYLKRIAQHQNATTGEQMGVPFAETLWNQIGASFVQTFTNPKKYLWDAGDAMDVLGLTFFRNIMVFGNCWASSSNSDAANKNSIYAHLVSDGGHVTPAGWGIFSAGPIAYLAGLLRSWYREYRKKRVISAPFVYARVSALGYKDLGIVYEKSEEAFTKDLLAYNKKCLEKNKVVDLGKQTKTYAKGMEDLLKIYEPDPLTRFVGLFNGKMALSERNVLFDFLGSDYDLPEPEVPRAWWEKVIAGGSLAVKRVWDYVNENSFIYWLVWFPFVSVIGIAAASTSPIFAPIIVGITLGLGLFYTLTKLEAWFWNFFDTDEEIKDKKEEARLDEVESPRMTQACNTRYFLKQERGLNREYLDKVGAPELKKKKREYDKTPHILKTEKKDVMESELAQYLLRGSSARRWTSIFTEFVNGIITTSFGFWIVSAVSFAFGGASAFFAFFDSMFNSGVTGLLFGSFFGIRKYFDTKAEHRDFKKLIRETLSAHYKGMYHKNEKGERDMSRPVTNLDRFNHLAKMKEFRSARIEWRRLQKLLDDVDNNADLYLSEENKKKFEFARAACKRNYNNKNLSLDQHKKNYQELRDLRIRFENELRSQNSHRTYHWTDTAGHYNLDKIDVYNHEIFEKQRHEAGWWTWIKRAANHVYVFVAGGQSGLLLARSLFLYGCVFGGAVIGIAAAGATGALPIFLGIAVALAVIYAVARLVLYMLDEDRKHKEHMAKNFNQRLDYLEDKNLELKRLERKLAPPPDAEMEEEHDSDQELGDAPDFREQNRKEYGLVDTIRNFFFGSSQHDVKEKQELLHESSSFDVSLSDSESEESLSSSIEGNEPESERGCLGLC